MKSNEIARSEVICPGIVEASKEGTLDNGHDHQNQNGTEGELGRLDHQSEQVRHPLSPSRHSPLLTIVGPTASGKTATAIALARELGGEVISADSRYLYRGMDVGTAKPTLEEMAGIPHHLIDIADPTDDYSLALYQRDAYAAIGDVLGRDKLPILAGGTPLYLNAVLEGWRIPEAAPDPTFRAEMDAIANESGNDALHARLATIDPAAAGRIPATNRRRVIRALEIHHLTGRPMSELEGKSPPPYRVLKLGLMPSRDRLVARIERRVDAQIEQGFVEEVQRLLDAAVPLNAPAMSAIGYRELADYLGGRSTLAEAIERIRFHTHRYVRHQLGWLRKMPDVVWFDPEADGWFERLREEVIRFLSPDETASRTRGVD